MTPLLGQQGGGWVGSKPLVVCSLPIEKEKRKKKKSVG